MTGQQQIDFQAVDSGSCEIDDVKLWKASEVARREIVLKRRLHSS